MGSTRSATSPSSRSSRRAGSSSSTRWSAGRSPGSSSPASRRASELNSNADSRPVPGRRHPGDAVRRQGAQRGLQRHGLPDGRVGGASRGREAGGVRLLEPIDTVDILIDDEYMGAVMGDLSARRARVLGTEPVGTGRTLVKAEAPQLELVRYATELRSLSHGTGRSAATSPATRACPHRVRASSQHVLRDPMSKGVAQCQQI